jgi:hypothetical protein
VVICKGEGGFALTVTVSAPCLVPDPFLQCKPFLEESPKSAASN